MRLISALCVMIAVALNAAQDELLFVQIVWRHGDRAPVETYPTDEHQEDAWPHGWGELTELGMKQQYSLGRVIRDQYIKGDPPLLSPTYNAKQIYIRSTDVNRTLISAMANLAGMYPEGVPGSDYPRFKNDTWPSRWTPIPVHTVELDTDYIGNVFARCPRATQLDEQIRASENYVRIEDENQEFINFLIEKSKMIVDLKTIYLLNDVYHIETIYNLSQPEWFTREVASRLRNLTEIANEFNYGISKPYVPEMIKLRGGSLLKTLISNMKMKIECEGKERKPECKWFAPLKYHAFSAHDTTVAALLSTFGDEEEVIRGGLPKYTASVSIELWRRKDIGFAVKILFHSAFHRKYHAITRLTKGCPRDSDFCSLKQFEKRSRKFIPEDINEECKAKQRRNENRTKYH